MVHLRCFCYSACKDIVFPAKTMIAPDAASYRPNPLLLARRSISYRGMVPRSISIRPEPDEGTFRTYRQDVGNVWVSGSGPPMDTFRSRCRVVRNVPGVVPRPSVSISEPPIDTFGATLRVVKNHPTGASELPIGWFENTRRQVPKYPSGISELPTDRFGTTHRPPWNYFWNILSDS